MKKYKKHIKQTISLIIAISFATINCGTPTRMTVTPPHQTYSHVISTPVIAGVSYLKIQAPSVDSLRRIYLDGCCVGTIATIDSIGVLAGEHIVSFFPNFYTGIKQKLNVANGSTDTSYAVTVFDGADATDVWAAGTYYAYIEPNKTITISMNYREVTRVANEIEATRRAVATNGLLITVGLAIVSVVIGIAIFRGSFQ